MIVSASYRTDIPAFYGEWFRRRLAAGACRVRNPYGGPDSVVDLRRPAVDGFVFWTRNAAPFLATLEDLDARGFPFVVQYTITGYSRALEARTPPLRQAVATARGIARRFGPRVVVWRYDPILITDRMDAAWHRRRFSRLARDLAGASDEAVVSFATIYRKTARNLDAAARRHGFAWRAPDAAERRALVGELAPLAAAAGMHLTVCAQDDARLPGVSAARCVDADRLAAVAGSPIAAPAQANRPGCGCHRARDIGAYETCTHGCVYCYAVDRSERARVHRRRHDPDRPALAPDSGPAPGRADTD